MQFIQIIGYFFPCTVAAGYKRMENGCFQRGDLLFKFNLHLFILFYQCFNGFIEFVIGDGSVAGTEYIPYFCQRGGKPCCKVINEYSADSQSKTQHS